MDKTYEKTVKYLKEHPDIPLIFSSFPKDLDVSEEDLIRCARYLVEQDLAKYADNQFGIHMGIIPTYQLIHAKEIKRDSFKQWFFSSFIGGIVTGVATTLATEACLYLCAKLAGLL